MKTPSLPGSSPLSKQPIKPTATGGIGPKTMFSDLNATFYPGTQTADSNPLTPSVVTSKSARAAYAVGMEHRLNELTKQSDNRTVNQVGRGAVEGAIGSSAGTIGGLAISEWLRRFSPTSVWFALNKTIPKTNVTAISPIALMALGNLTGGVAGAMHGWSAAGKNYDAHHMGLLDALKQRVVGKSASTSKSASTEKQAASLLTKLRGLAAPAIKSLKQEIRTTGAKADAELPEGLLRRLLLGKNFAAPVDSNTWSYGKVLNDPYEVGKALTMRAGGGMATALGAGYGMDKLTEKEKPKTLLERLQATLTGK